MRTWILLACLAGTLLHAQQTMTTAAVGGRVEDSTSAPITGATVNVTSVDKNQTWTAASDDQGRFLLTYLPVGEYELSVRKSGFSTVTNRLTLTLGSRMDLVLKLTVAGLREQIDVTAAGPVLETARTQIAGTVVWNEIAALPLNGRNYLDLALLVPGVSPTNTASTQLFAETSAVPGQGISVGSQRNFSNNFIVDGLSANDDAAGLSGVFYGVDVVNEFQVVTSGGQAEFGRALGGYISMVTKSGTNHMRGNLYGYFRNQRLNAANALSGAKLPSTQAQYGASLGGPLTADRTFYFANFEQRRLNQSGLVTITPANVAAINARLAAVGYKGPQIATGLYPNPVHHSTFLAKADHQFSPRDQFSVRYSLYDVQSDNSRGAGALSAATASAGLDDTDQTLAASNVATFSARLVNETRGQFTHSSLKALPTAFDGPAVSIAGVATFGTLSGSPTGRVNKLYEIVDNLSYHAGGHSIRMGTDFLYNDTAITFPRAARGSYSFSSLANFLQGTYNNSGFTQTLGNSLVSQTNPSIGFYAQDEWKVGPSLTLNGGLRYDLQFLKSISTDTNNLSPRLGLAWSPMASRRTVVRGGFGLFYDRVPLRALANALLSSGNTTSLSSSSQVSVSLSPGQTGAPVFPQILASLPSNVLPNFTTMNPQIQNAYSVQGSLEIEQQIGERSTLRIGYQHVRGLHLIMSINQNVPGCAAAGNNNGCRPNPSYANNSQYSSAADSRYDGLHVSFVQRPARWGNYRVSYTYSKALDNVGEFFFSSPIDNFNVWRDYGRSDDDQRRRFVVDGAIHAPTGPAKTAWQRIIRGFQLGGMLQYYSSLPLNITAGTTTIQGTGARPILNGDFIGRNVGTGFDLINLNARVSRAFQINERLRLEGIFEAFNTLNRVNGVTRNGTFGPGAYPGSPLPSFRRTTSVADPRTLQLALRLVF